MSIFIPLYDRKELENLLICYQKGILNNIVGEGKAVRGFSGLEQKGGHMRSLSLAERFTEEEIDRKLKEFAESDRETFLLFVAKYIYGWTLERLAAAYATSVSTIQGAAIDAADGFMCVLLDEQQTTESAGS